MVLHWTLANYKWRGRPSRRVEKGLIMRGAQRGRKRAPSAPERDTEQEQLPLPGRLHGPFMRGHASQMLPDTIGKQRSDNEAETR